MPLLTPIPIGFVLDNRYEVAQFLGYGGFGRTYLARDRQRFSELCVLKEFAPQISSPEILRKAAELFQREAGTLYQLRHPQIPEFRAILQATIDNSDVLLIIEQYIAGETYEQWVDAGNRLDETGAIQFLQDLLPVLGYVHDRGVIHRDISPDNLIREARTTKPFLIDFGSVKQVATTAMQMSGVMSGTQIHKPGFSPPEQLRGDITPSTDLYSLAVTTVVLMTGRSPLELYDGQMAQWRWREFVSVSPGFGDLLDRLLAYQSTDRPRTALNAAQLLQSLVGISGLNPGDLAPYIPPTPVVGLPGAVSNAGQTPAQTPARPEAPMSQMRTIAIAPAAPATHFPTTYPAQSPRLPRQSDRPQNSPDQNFRDQTSQDPDFQKATFDRNEPQDDILWRVIKFPWTVLVWCLKALWMGIKAIDWVLTWVWRAILIVALLAGGAAASYFWSLRSEPPVAQQRRSPQSEPQNPGLRFPELPQFPELKLPTFPEVQLPTLPEIKLPDWTQGKSTSCVETIARSEEIGLTKAKFYQKVNARFVEKHPELNGRSLTDGPEDAALRQDWCAIADKVLSETPKTP